MAKDPAKDKESTKPKIQRDGHTDELELLREIIAGNRGLMLRVLDKIRAARSTSGKTLMDEAKEKQNKQRGKSKT